MSTQQPLSPSSPDPREPSHSDEPTTRLEVLADRFNHLSIWHFSAVLATLIGVAGLICLIIGSITAAWILAVVFVVVALITAGLRIVGI